MKEYPDATEFPKTLRVNRHVGDKLWLAGIGDRQQAKIMFITPCVQEEEVLEYTKLRSGRLLKGDPRYLNHAAGTIFKDLAARYGIDVNSQFFTSVVKFLPIDKKHQKKPTKELMESCLPVLEADIEEVRPDLIVCLGKWVFDLIVGVKAKASEINGAWFTCHKHKCLSYPMSPIMTLIAKPESAEKFKMEFKAIRRWMDARAGKIIPMIPQNYKTIHNAAELRQLVMMLARSNRTILAVDCEWHGQQHVDGKLRSMQLCWAPGECVYIRFMDDKLNYTFDISYREAGKILSIWLDRPEVKYIGHHVSADLPWMSHWLGLEWYGKALFDTEFAEQCCDESAPLGLDDLALKYTDLGKYDWELLSWKRGHRDLVTGGYGYIPDDILIPYGCRDVDTTFRSYLAIKGNLEAQGLTDYYYNLFNPFTTDVFTLFAINGLPMDIEQVEALREVYHYVRRELEKDFQHSITEEAEELLKTRLMADFGDGGEEAYARIAECSLQGSIEEAAEVLKNLCGVEQMGKYQSLFDHYYISPEFNIRSMPQMRRWLFVVKGYTPVASTSNKENGMPAVSWEKVMQYPPDRQKEFTPAAGKETLRILAAQHNDERIKLLLRFNAVGNICKSFLKEAEVDEETGETIKEEGIRYWIASDGAAHTMTSSTETGRPRS